MTSFITRRHSATATSIAEVQSNDPIKKIAPTTAVSQVSIFSDDLWSYYDESLRGSLDYRCEAEIRWSGYRGALKESLITEMKVLTYVCINKHFVLYSKRGVKPKTVITEVKRLICAMTRSLNLEHIGYLSDVTASEWRTLIASTRSRIIIQAILKKLTHPALADYLHGGLPSLRLEHLRGLAPRGYDTNTTVGLPFELFGMLSHVSQRTVLVFLNLINCKAHSPDSAQLLPVGEASAHSGQLSRAFAAHIEYAATVRAKKWTYKRRSRFQEEFKTEFGVPHRLFVSYLRLVHGAALSFVALYTGMRASELRLLRKNGLFLKDGQYYIRTTVTKHQSLANAVDCDLWVATDALVDAMTCLQQLSAVNGSPFLAQLPAMQPAVEARRAPNGIGIARSLKEFFRAVVRRGPYASWNLTPQQFREGLAEQMARMHVKMPYASMQLKHLAVSSQRALRGLPADITMQYGNYPRTLLSTVVGVDAVARIKTEQASSLFGAQRAFAGGGAQLHREKVEAYFAGMGLEGKEREDFIAKIAPHVSVYASGIGFCTLNLLREHVASAPPCLGDLQCNPFDCSNSVVPAYNRPAIKLRLEKCDEAMASGDVVDKERLQRLRNAYLSMLEQLDEA
ncbi:hypothetical protein [Paraburkholderia phenoliruptrix]|uniref:hypothetical protein n=1 Tax=Paraburkholderia phenoliruptrix TaxID=252970 RepID=UPI001C4E9337|nr:hypothetical protein [Paraburkholderia phenoliruptrix]MBW0446009.1 hypothetical protein [Paraburkholderia phenoliruptrix]MBW9100011.1 hypothetical protein [Paraburkholderia phenoliruptrix]